MELNNLAYKNSYFLFDSIIDDRYVQPLINYSNHVPLPTGTLTTIIESDTEKEYDAIFLEPVVLKNHLYLNKTFNDVQIYAHKISKKN